MSQIRLAYQELFEGKPIERSSYADFMHIFDENDDDTLAPVDGTYGFVSHINWEMCSFPTASGYFHVAADNDGKYQLREFNENIFNIFRQVVDIVDSEYFCGWKYGETEIKYEFYDVLLGLRAADALEDNEMLELIFDNLAVDSILAFMNTGGTDLSQIFYTFPYMIEKEEKP